MNYDRFIQEAKTKDCDILRDEPLSRHTTFRIGGTADWMVIPHTAQAAGELYTLLEREGLPWFPLGRGSNLLVGDGGYRGVVLKSANKYGRLSFDGEAVEVDAGVSLARLCYSAYQHGLSGLEFAWGIPGSVGGAAYMNAGAYDGEMKDVLSSVTFWEGGGRRPSPGRSAAFPTATATFPTGTASSPGSPSACGRGRRGPSRRRWTTCWAAATPNSPWSSPALAAPSNAPRAAMRPSSSTSAGCGAFRWAGPR
ncbi:FAD-binding protein [Bittarella massiliensis (ex Durand et al. 2017)]|uniref:FAD-binding protein n=1 Tax=Bittarella massiliensis (ex Durand et al. 2017) TaxID=1720313 RepID=UPI0034A08E51